MDYVVYKSRKAETVFGSAVFIAEPEKTALADALLRKDIGRKDTVILKPGGKLDIEKAPVI